MKVVGLKHMRGMFLVNAVSLSAPKARSAQTETISHWLCSPLGANPGCECSDRTSVPIEHETNPNETTSGSESRLSREGES